MLLLLLPAATGRAPARAQGARSYTCLSVNGLDPGIAWNGEATYTLDGGGEPRLDTKTSWVTGDNDWNPLTMWSSSAGTPSFKNRPGELPYEVTLTGSITKWAWSWSEGWVEDGLPKFVSCTVTSGQSQDLTSVSYVPLAGKPGMTVGIQIVNSEPTTARVRIDYLTVEHENLGGDLAGSDYADVPGDSSVTLSDARPPGFEGLFTGSARIGGLDGAAGLSVITNHVWGPTHSSSRAHTSGSNRVRLPLLARNNSGTTTSWFAVQNVGPSSATIDIAYSYQARDAQGRTGPAREQRTTLKPSSARVYDQRDAPGDAPQTFAGTISATGPVAVTVFQESRGRLLEYEGASRGDDEVAVPLAVANNFGHAFTGIQAQNAGTAETQVTVRYGPNTATRTAPGASKLCPDPGDSRPQTVAPGASATFLQRADGDARFADCTYVGSATVTSSNGQPLIVVGNQLGDNGGSSFLGTPVSALDRAVDMPLVQANNYGSISGIQVQNVGDGPGRLNITFGPNTATVRPGRPDPCPAPPRTVDERLEARASRTLVLPADDPTVADCTYIGTARATIRTLDPNAGAPLLVGLVNQVIPGLDDNLSTYEAL